MKVINSINYNTHVKNGLYETLNNRNEVKKDSVLISKPEVNHEVANVVINNKYHVTRFKNPAAIRENSILQNMRSESEKGIRLIKDLADYIEAKNLDYDVNLGEDVFYVKMKREILKNPSLFGIEDQEKFKENSVMSFSNIMRNYTKLHSSMLDTYESGLKVFFHENDENLELFNMDDVNGKEDGKLDVVSTIASTLRKDLKSIKLEIVKTNWKADRDTLEEFGTILGYKKEDFNEDLLRKLDTVLCDKIDGLDDLFIEELDSTLGYKIDGLNDFILKKGDTVLGLLQIENLKNCFLKKIDTVLFSKIGGLDKALFDKIDTVTESLDMFIDFYKYIEFFFTPKENKEKSGEDEDKTNIILPDETLRRRKLLLDIEDRYKGLEVKCELPISYMVDGSTEILSQGKWVTISPLQYRAYQQNNLETVSKEDVVA